MSRDQVRLEATVDLFDVAKMEHIAREQGRDFDEVAAEGAVVVVGDGNRVKL